MMSGKKRFYTSGSERKELHGLLEAHNDGFALDRKFYTSEFIYDYDIKYFWNQTWIWVGHICQIPNPGDFFRFDYGPESILVVRNREGIVSAFLNLCRHRGSRVCVESSGNKSVFSCPYHAWTYDLDGQLRMAKEMATCFDKKTHGLLKVHLKIFQGLIFICTAQDPPDINKAIEMLSPLTLPFRLERLKIANQKSYLVSANWKLAVENYMECYHCAAAHKEYSRSHSLKDPASITSDLMTSLYDASKMAGLSNTNVSINGVEVEDYDMDVYFARYPLYSGYQTGSENGEILAPLLGDLKRPFGGANDLQLGIQNNFLIYSDYVVGYRFIPFSVKSTDMQVVWYVHQDAKEGRDYNKNDISWLWHLTSLDDERIINTNQEGINSFHFVPGPLSEMEWGIRAFYISYLRALGVRSGFS